MGGSIEFWAVGGWSPLSPPFRSAPAWMCMVPLGGQPASGREWLNFCHLFNLNWELPKLVAIKGLITGVSIFSTPVPSRSAARSSRPAVSRSETPRFPPFFDISRRGHIQSNLLQSPQSSSTLSRWKSRPPKRLRPLGSLARVKTAITFLGSATRHDYSSRTT